MYYYYGYNVLLYDIPIFILFFGLVFIILKKFVAQTDPVINTAIAAVSASFAYIIIRENLYKWLLTHTTSVFAIVIGIIVLMFAYFALKFM